MAVFYDSVFSSHELDADVREATSPGASARADTERDYVACRRAVIGMLRADFPRLGDYEELYQEAWADLLELEARGEVVRNRRALLKKIAFRRAVDVVRQARAEPVDPLSDPYTQAVDAAAATDDEALRRLDAASVRLVIDSLDDRQAAVLKLRFDLNLSAKEIQSLLGIGPKRLEKIMTKAYRQVLAQLEAPPDGAPSAWTRRQRSLLLACEVGWASSSQRRRAQQMVERDATARAMLREMRAALRDVAVVLPWPVFLQQPEHHLRPLEGLIGRLNDLWLSTRQLPYDLTTRRLPGPDVLDRAAGAAGLGATAKIVAMCLAVGGTATVCYEGARSLEHHSHPRRAHHARPARIVEPDRAAAAVVRTAPRRAQTASVAARQVAKEVPVSHPKSTPPASPAPTGSTEFGPGSVGSAGASNRPAAAPTNGGGEFSP